jgi:hypothetical protein
MATLNDTVRHNDRNYRVRVRSVGANFGTVASVRIGGKEFQSSVRPYGFNQAAIDEVFAQVGEWQATR